MAVNRRIFQTGIVLLACVVMASAAAEAQNQRRQGRRRGRFSFGGGQIGKSMLLGSEKVQKELTISEEQKSKITEMAKESRPNFQELFSGLSDLPKEERGAKFREILSKLAQEADKKVAEILTEKQNKRLGEIHLQFRGFNALADKELAGKLKITEDQQQKVKDLFEAQRDMRRELFSGSSDLSREERQKKYGDLRKETETAVLGVLTAAQKEAFDKMKGAKIEIDRRSLFRGFGRRNLRNSSRPQRPSSK